MEGCDGTLDGQPGELTLHRYRRFGAGGAKLIWGEAAAVVEDGRANPRQLLVNENTLSGLATIVNVCREAHREANGNDSDLVIGLQLTHSGRYSYRPSTLDDDGLSRLVDRYVTAAKLAQRAGYQFVDVKQCHGYLLNELLGGRSRPGKYGGSYENRTQLAREIVSAIRAAVPGVMIATRISVYDGVPFVKDADGRGVPCDHSSAGRRWLGHETR